MKIFGYRNKWRLILEILFNKDRFINKIEKEKSDLIVDLTQLFTNKIRFLCFSKYTAGIVTESFFKRVPVIQIPIEEETRPLCGPNACVRIKEMKVTRLYLPICSEHIPIDYIKREAAHILARSIIENGFLNWYHDDNRMTFYINTFE